MDLSMLSRSLDLLERLEEGQEKIMSKEEGQGQIMSTNKDVNQEVENEEQKI